jgi:mannose-6-phosphate isomerase-like protein (cupin superfamily)
MSAHYTSLLGHAQGARKIHVHLTVLETRDAGGGHEHSHAAEEAMYFLEGEAEFVYGGETHRVGPGDLLFFPPGQPHAQVKYLSERMKYLVIRTVEPGDEPCCCGQDRPPGSGRESPTQRT